MDTIDVAQSLLNQGLAHEDVITKTAEATGRSRDAVEMSCRFLFLGRRAQAESPVPPPAPAPVEPAPEPPKPKPVRKDGAPLGTIDLTDLKLPHDAPHILIPIVLVRSMTEFWQRAAELTPACFDVLLACYAVWNRQGCRSLNGQFLLHTSYAELSRMLGHKAYGGWQHRWLKQNLESLAAAGKIVLEERKHGRNCILIQIAPELCPSNIRGFKPFDLIAYRSMRSRIARYTYVRAGYQVARNGTGELGGDTLAESLGVRWTPSREKTRLEMIKEALDALPLYQDCTLNVSVLPKVDGGLKLSFKATGKAVAIKAAVAKAEAARKDASRRGRHDSSPTRIEDILKGMGAAVA